MGIFNSVGNAVNGLLGESPGGTDTSLFSGIPFFGEGFAQSESQRYNSAEARHNQGFQKQMSDTAHQREVADLKQAGLNPILSVNTGATTPGGASGSSSPLSGGSSSANMLKAMYTKEKQKSDALISKTEAEATTEKERKKLITEQRAATQSSAKKADQETKMLKNQNVYEGQKAEFMKDNAKHYFWNDVAQKYLSTAQQGADTINPVSNIMKGIFGGLKGKSSKQKSNQHKKTYNKKSIRRNY